MFKRLRLGRLPAEAEIWVPSATRRIEAESLRASVTMLDLRSPGWACNWRRIWFVGSIAMSDRRIVAYRWNKRLINTDFDDPRFPELEFSAEGPVLKIAHEAGVYREGWSGVLEYRFRTPLSEKIVEFVTEWRRRSNASVHSR